jgi:hypothetical protein
MKKLVGHIGVDSGSIMVIDPCYFNSPERWNLEHLEKLEGFAKEHEAKGEIRMADNTRRFAKEKREMHNIVADWDSYCTESTHTAREYAGGVITPTRNGDGQFPVYAHYDKDNKIKKLEVVF